MPLSAGSTDRTTPPLDGRRILVVEDHAHTAQLVKQTLVAAGAYEVILATDGEDALRMLPSVRPDIIVTDMIMPVVGGLELVETVRRAALTPDPAVPNPRVPIVLVSAFASREAVRIARGKGIDAFVVKPFSIGSLVKRVDRAGNRQAEFIVSEAYVGPCRRGAPGSNRGRRIKDLIPPEQMAPVRTAPAPKPAPEPPPLALVDEKTLPPEHAGPSQLAALYARIRELEDEREEMRSKAS